jgi:cytochrome c-type biogenesis protein CcmH
MKRLGAPHHGFRTGRIGLPLLAVAIVAVIATVWCVTLFRTPAEGGSLEARVTAVGATVRCPICPEPIPLNDVQTAQAIQMRQFIRDQLRHGLSEDQVRQELVARYGTGILLAPPQRGFDLLAWVVPFGALVACAIAALAALRRWSSSGARPDDPSPPALPTGVGSPEARRYEELLDRELAARE